MRLFGAEITIETNCVSPRVVQCEEKVDAMDDDLLPPDQLLMSAVRYLREGGDDETADLLQRAVLRYRHTPDLLFRVGSDESVSQLDVEIFGTRALRDALNAAGSTACAAIKEALDPFIPLDYYLRDLHARLKPVEAHPDERVQGEMLRYVDADRFRAAYPAAYVKWAAAARLLWSENVDQHLTRIGHDCREAMQEFAQVLAEGAGLSDALPADKAKTVARVRAVLAASKARLGEREAPFLDAMLAMWGTISDLAQRQEHGTQKASPLVREDARRLVFATLYVMTELDATVAIPQEP